MSVSSLATSSSNSSAADPGSSVALSRHVLRIARECQTPEPGSAITDELVAGEPDDHALATPLLAALASRKQIGLREKRFAEGHRVRIPSTRATEECTLYAGLP